VSGSFKEVGSKIIYLDIPKDDQGMPCFDTLRIAYEKINQLASKGQIRSAYAIGKGGLVAALTQMAIGNSIGAKVELDKALEQKAFAAAYGDLVLEVGQDVSLEESTFKQIGYTTLEEKVQVQEVIYTLQEALAYLKKPLQDIFTLSVDAKEDGKDATYRADKKIYVAKNKIAKPKVVIPVFPGTNCERDTRRAFEKAGAEVEEILLVNRNETTIRESIEAIYKAIQNAQILAFAGGFSAGDEPDGSGKFIASTFRNERLKEVVHAHLNEKDGLVLGICNGFQVLVKLGLLPYGEIKEMTKHAPTLTFNTIGRHISEIAKTKITSTQSPWLTHVQVGEVYEIPVSHGEGRFVAPQEVLEELIQKGQVFSQYVDAAGNPSKDGMVNLNGSLENIEGIVSEDGRIIGKMGHSERVGDFVHLNIPGKKDQKLFLSGVEYFK
jgi:phosphoribosylformylglycinamidine synthase